MPLGDYAQRALATLCRRFHVKPEHVLQSIAEQFLADACSDDTLAPCAADEARVIARTGKVPEYVWRNGTELVTPGFEREEVA